jgi:murein DD-endopeptidase MepM/ murein hydrolase activator NlpD
MAVVILVAGLFLGLFLALLTPAGLHAQSPQGSHTVQPGDTLGQIATRYNVTVEDLAAANNIDDINRISVGQVLIIPGQGRAWVISQPGETVETIALAWQVPVAQVAALNGISQTQRLFPGQPIRLPPTAVAPDLRFGSVTHMDFTPAVVQGQTGWLRIESRRPLSLSVHLGDLPLPLMPWPAEEAATSPTTLADAPVAYAGHLPVSALSPPGPLALNVGYTTTQGEPVSRTFSLQVVDGGYFNQQILLPPEQSDLLDPQTNDPELAIFEEIWSVAQTPVQWWGAFSRPIGPEYPNTSPFGTRRSYNGGVYSNFHTGEDFGAPVGVSITAPGDGIVVLARPLAVRGNAVLMDHGRGVFSGYWHLSDLFVEEGEWVEAGQILGLVGNTGRSTGPHLHWELRIHGVAVNPMQFLAQPLFGERE